MIGLAFVAFVVCCVLPVAYLLATTLGAARGGTPSALDSRQRAAQHGASLSARLFRDDDRCASWNCARARPTSPRSAVRPRGCARLLPPYIVALAWVNLGWDWLSEWTYSLPAAIVVLSLVLYPLSMLATEVAMRRIDGRLEEAGLIVASPGRVLRGITLPLVAPSVVAAALIIFVLAVSEFGVPAASPRTRPRCSPLLQRCYDFSACPRPAAARAMRRGRRRGRRIARGSARHDTSVACRLAGGVPCLAPACTRGRLVIAMALALPLLILVREALGARSLDSHRLDRRHREQPAAGGRGGDTHWPSPCALAMRRRARVVACDSPHKSSWSSCSRFRARSSESA